LDVIIWKILYRTFLQKLSFINDFNIFQKVSEKQRQRNEEQKRGEAAMTELKNVITLFLYDGLGTNLIPQTKI
jgi:hypothetical protein